MITTCIRTLLLLTVTLALSGTTPLQAEVYAPPRGFDWRKSVPLHLVLDPAVVSDLGLNDEVAGKVRDLQNQIQKELEQELAKPQAKPELLHTIRNRHAEEINALLTPVHQTRLHQIHLHNPELPTDARLFGLGLTVKKDETDVLSDSMVATELKLTDTQRKEISSIHTAIKRAEGALVKRGKQVGPYYRDLMRESPAKILKVLTAEQREAFGEMMRNPLKIYPTKQTPSR